MTRGIIDTRIWYNQRARLVLTRTSHSCSFFHRIEANNIVLSWVLLSLFRSGDFGYGYYCLPCFKAFLCYHHRYKEHVETDDVSEIWNDAYDDPLFKSEVEIFKKASYEEQLTHYCEAVRKFVIEEYEWRNQKPLQRKGLDVHSNNSFKP